MIRINNTNSVLQKEYLTGFLNIVLLYKYLLFASFSFSAENLAKWKCCYQSKDQLVADSVDPAAKLKTGDARDNKLGTVIGQVIYGGQFFDRYRNLLSSVYGQGTSWEQLLDS